MTGTETSNLTDYAGHLPNNPQRFDNIIKVTAIRKSRRYRHAHSRKAFSALTDEQKRRVEAARTPEELLAIAKESGYELTTEELNKVSGGHCELCMHEYCPKKEVESSSW